MTEPRTPKRLSALFGASHPIPVVAVTALACGLGAGAGLRPGRLLRLTVAVGAGQLTIGWGNDLIDAERDRRVGRADKPLATGVLDRRTVVGALAATAVTCVGASLGTGVRSAGVHLGLVVGSGWAYNLGVKRTRVSFLPYALAFGSLPAVATLAADPPVGAPGWAAASGALLGVGTHVLNVLPDLDDDLATGVRGMPQRFRPATLRRLAAGLLASATSVTLAHADLGPAPTASIAAVASGLAGAAWFGDGQVPFRAAIGSALLNVAVLAKAL